MSANRWRPKGGGKRNVQQKSKVREGDEKVPVPRHLIGRVIGTKGQTIRKIESETGAVIIVEDNTVYVRGTQEQRQKALLMIENIVQDAESGRSTRPKRCLRCIPPECMSKIIGKSGGNLQRIENETGTKIKVLENVINIVGEEEDIKKAAIKIKETAASVGYKKGHEKKFVHVEAPGVSDDDEFRLKRMSGLNEEKRLRICLSEDLEPATEEMHFHEVERLKVKVLEVLRQIWEPDINSTVDMWCHFGKSCIKGVDEDQEEGYFTLSGIREKFETASEACARGPEWKSSLDVGIEEIEVEKLEACLADMACSRTYDFRHDFTFYTPSCRDVRVKVWLESRENGDKGGDGAGSMVFAREAPVPVNNLRCHKLSENSDVRYYVCVPFQSRMKADILLPCCPFDCRLLIRTVVEPSDTTTEDEVEDLLLYDYLDKMKIEGDRLVLPPVSELPEDFDLHFRRLSYRRTYMYAVDGDTFSVTVCKDQPLRADGTPNDTKKHKKDVHLHCDEWDRALSEGNWEPEQIVSKFPQFLEFVSKIQRNVNIEQDEV